MNDEDLLFKIDQVQEIFLAEQLKSSHEFNS